MGDTIGTILLISYISPPPNWLPCDGSTLHIEEYKALYGVIGTTYGGDGNIMFGLPDLRSNVPNPSMMYIICVHGQYPATGE